ncbi:BTB domain-containing protein [Mycena sanguinolenta]|uniref:BTB domain-containing protein n=1 Tax=Mycena sanguinolenta TaxID=230812 RepID=A0A8H6ZEU0_9AGAR|nr:BTB domain-containing protein [Mycena sanguinolenta]
MADSDMGELAPSSSMDRRDPDLYIEDGNIVLSAKDNENNTVYFRVHKSTLVKNSPEAFGNMFSVPTPPNMDQYDGVPLVQMPDDAKSLRDFLTILYDPQCIATILKAEDFPKMLRPVELARKYQVDWICKLVASQLQSSWPDSLFQWNIVAREEGDIRAWDAYRTEAPEGDMDEPRGLRCLPEPVSSIILARQCDVPAILPVAFLHLLRFPSEIYDYNEVFPWQIPERSLLSQQDWARLVLARERITRWFTQEGPQPWKDCGTSGMQCQVITLTTWLNIAQEVAVDGNILKLYGRQVKGDICDKCKQKLEDRFYHLSVQFFRNLKHFFQLDE